MFWLLFLATLFQWLWCTVVEGTKYLMGLNITDIIAIKNDSCVMTKPAFVICGQQRRRSACPSAQSVTLFLLKNL